MMRIRAIDVENNFSRIDVPALTPGPSPIVRGENFYDLLLLTQHL
jgi:hypothetical protein